MNTCAALGLWKPSSLAWCERSCCWYTHNIYIIYTSYYFLTTHTNVVCLHARAHTHTHEHVHLFIHALGTKGITWTLVGHSERRTKYGEKDEDCAEKARPCGACQPRARELCFMFRRASPQKPTGVSVLLFSFFYITFLGKTGNPVKHPD